MIPVGKCIIFKILPLIVRQSAQERLQIFEATDYEPVWGQGWLFPYAPPAAVALSFVALGSFCHYTKTPCLDIAASTFSDYYHDWPLITIPSLVIAGILSNRLLFPALANTYKKHYKTKESLIQPGIDRRYQVEDTTSWPNRIHGYMEMVFGADTYVGSGTLIGEQSILTAGHNLMDETGMRASEIRFYPGRHGEKRIKLPGNDKYFLSRNFEVHKHYDGNNRMFDVGVIKLPKNTSEFIKNHLGYASYGIEGDEELLSKTISITGYPGQKGKKTYMYSMSGSIKQKDPVKNRLYYDVDTSPGQSGSAVYEITTTASDEDSSSQIPHIKAVHTHGISSSSFISLWGQKKTPHHLWNSGTLLENDILNFVDSTVQQISQGN